MEYKEKIKDLENKRKVVIKRLLYSIGLIIISILIGYLIDSSIGFVVGGFMGIIFTIIVVSISYNKYKKDFKSNFMPLIILKSGLDLNYNYKDGIGENTVNYSGLFKKSDKYFKEDLIYGTLDGVRFMSSDVHMQERRVTRNHKGRRHVEYVTYFKGRWFVYEFNKKFNGIIQVREDSFLSGQPSGLNLKKIELE